MCQFSVTSYGLAGGAFVDSEPESEPESAGRDAAKAGEGRLGGC